MHVCFGMFAQLQEAFGRSLLGLCYFQAICCIFYELLSHLEHVLVRTRIFFAQEIREAFNYFSRDEAKGEIFIGRKLKNN